MATSQDQYPSGSCFLTSAEKQIVFDKYLIVTPKKKYVEYLQHFISSEYPKKQISSDYVRKLVHRANKRKPKEVFLREITNARNSVIFSRADTFKNQCEFCIDFSPTLQAAVSSHKLTEECIIYRLKKLEKADGFPPRYNKKPKTSHSSGGSSELLQETGAPVAVVQEGVAPAFEHDALLPPPIQAAADIPEDEQMHHEAEIQQEVTIIAQPQYGHGAIPQPTVHEAAAYSPMKQNLFPRVLITEDQMKITGYKVECLKGRAAHRFYAGDKLYNILPHSHRVNTSLEAADQYHMFLYYSATGQQESSSRQKILGCVFVDIGYCSDVIIVTVCWLYSDPSSARGITRLGSKIVQKLFKRFPNATFELCSKREAAPFWYKKGFVPKDAATMDKFKELCIRATREYPINVAAWLDIYGDGDQTEMICTPERRKDEKMKKKKEEEEEEKKKDKGVKKKKKKKAFCSSRTTNKMLDIMSAIEEAKKLGSSVGYCSLK